MDTNVIDRVRIFGPIPSRRLGRSLGINNLPTKVCTYSCVYCQVGRTRERRINRSPFYSPEEVAREVRDKVEEVLRRGEEINYLSFVPNGEPTLDLNLGQEIKLLKPLKFKIAVFTNSSLLGEEKVRESLLLADLVMVKVDTVSEEVYHRLNRPHHALRLSKVLDGLIKFTKIFSGELMSETMLVKGVNDSSDQIKAVASFLRELKPVKSYLLVPTRPPTEKWVKPSPEEVVTQASEIFRQEIDRVECLIDYEGTNFAIGENIEKTILDITSVHPLRKEALSEILRRAKKDWSIIQKMMDEGKLVEVRYGGEIFYRGLSP